MRLKTEGIKNKFLNNIYLFIKSKLSLAVIIILVQTSITSGQNFYISNAGSDSNPGTITLPWATIQHASTTLKAGQKVYIRSGRYHGYIIFSKSGTAKSPISFEAYPGEKPIIDGSNLKSEPSNPWNNPPLFNIKANYLVFKGLELINAAMVTIYCGDDTHNNLFDSIHIHNGYGTGIMFYLCSNHIVQNCLVHDIYDYDKNGMGGGGNADGISASAGNTIPFPNYGHHIFKNNTVYNCSDDGIDTWSSNGNIIENNEVHNTGYGNPSNGGSHSATWNKPAGNGNGFKLGGGGGGSGNNKVMNNISYSNRISGFDGNETRNKGSKNILYNNTAYNNPIGFRNLETFAIIKNNISFKNNVDISGNVGVSENNSWDLGIMNPNFISVIPNTVNFLRLSSNSPAIDKGQNLSTKGVLKDKAGTIRPKEIGYDLGAYEYNATPTN
ncbi:MAG TPA: right-handed parallel beta-helix repeat-containing protein [Flavobacterium alvei]|nr:right-handed parallel beta-helix repeat-containing protein [Flavobacterium alvei]